MKILKAYSTIFLIGLLLIPMSCKDDVIDLLTTPLEGTVWVVTKFAATGCTDPNSNGTETITCDASNCSTVVFSGGTFTNTEIDSGVTTTETNTYTVSGNSITVTDPGGTDTFTYVIVLNTLTLTGSGGDPGCTDTITLEKQS